MSTSDLTGKTALITGGSSGIGFAIAKALSEVGTKVILLARDENKLKDAASEIINASILSADVSDEPSIQAAFKKLDTAIDICFNNAGIFKPTPLLAENNKNFDDTIKTNIYGPWFVTKAVVKNMKDNKVPGSIINIGSIRANRFIKAGISAYCLSKAALQQMTKVLALELAELNIRVNCIDPGVFHTPITEKNIAEKGAELKQLIPVNFIAEPQDITALALYLASNEASKYVTGSCITIDGGASCLGSEH